jgi:NitT/TauT family transport system permease protein
MKKRQPGTHLKAYSAFVYALSFFCILAVWQIAAQLIHAPLILPSPHEVFACLASLSRTASFWHHVGASALRVFASFIITFVLGTVIGFCCGFSEFFRTFIELPIAVIRSTPVVSFILIAVFWFGSSFVPVFAAVLMALPVMITAVSSGFSHTDKKLVSMAHVYGMTRGQIFKYITLYAVKPSVAAGAVSSFGLSWKVVAAGEVLSLPKWGAGELLQIAQIHLETQEVLAVTVTIVTLSFVLEQAASFAVKSASKRSTDPHTCTKEPESLHFDKKKYGTADFVQKKEALQNHAKYFSLAVNHLSVERGGKKLYSDFSLSLAPSERLALIAPSGAGKTTLLDFIAGLIPFGEQGFEGSVFFDGKISYLFQEPRLIPCCTILENIMLPLENMFTAEEAYSRALLYLEKTRLSDKSNAYPGELSGGEKQRAALARAFAYPSDLLLMDEAFQSQDIKQKISLIDTLKSLLDQQPRSLILVTHDVCEAAEVCSRIVVMSGSPLVIAADEQNTPDKNIEDTVSRFIAKIRSL